MSRNAGIVFDLIGNDKSASEALEGVRDQGKKVAGAIGAAFAGMAIGDVITKSMDNEKVLAKFKAGLGQTKEVAEKAGKVAGQVYQEGIGGSLEEVLNAVGAIGTNMGDLGNISEPELAKISAGALNIATVMGVDVVDVTQAAGQMMRNGLAPDAQTAFDIIATGAQNGANRAGDLLDTFNEYSPQFASLGIDGQTALGMIKTGLDNGIFTSDLAADAFKEFSIRSVDGSKATGEAYTAIGLDADTMAAAIAKGGPTAKTAVGQIITALGQVTDPVAREKAGVALFGTQWEDTGAKAILAMNPVEQKTVDVKDATNAMGVVLNDTAQNKVDKIKRSFDGFMTSLVNTKGPMGDVMATAIGLGPQIVAFAGSVGMIITGLKALGVGASTSIMVAAAPLAALAAAIAAIAVVVKTALDNIGRMSAQLEAAKAGNWAVASSIRSPAATFGVGSWASPVQSSGTTSNGGSSYSAYNAKVGQAFSGVKSVFRFASGGVVMPRPGGTNAIIGEAGEAEAVIPLSKFGSMGGGDTINIHMPGGFAVGTADEIAQRLADIVTAAKRRGVIPQGVFG